MHYRQHIELQHYNYNCNTNEHEKDANNFQQPL